MHAIKDRNGINLIEAEEIRRGGKNLQKNYTKKMVLVTWKTRMVWSHTLECEVKWALGNITMNKTSGSDEIPAEIFQILKDDPVKVLH